MVCAIQPVHLKSSSQKSHSVHESHLTSHMVAEQLSAPRTLGGVVRYGAAHRRAGTSSHAASASQQSARLALKQVAAASRVAPLEGRQNEIRAMDLKSIGKPTAFGDQASGSRTFRFQFMAHRGAVEQTLRREVERAYRRGAPMCTARLPSKRNSTIATNVAACPSFLAQAKPWKSWVESDGATKPGGDSATPSIALLMCWTAPRRHKQI